MKKLLILMLVLGMTSAANAVITWSVDEVTIDITVDPTAVVQLVSDSGLSYTGVWVGADPSPLGVAEITSMTILPAALDGSAVPTAYAGWWQIEGLDFNPDDAIVVTPGNHFDVTITGLVEGTYTLGSDFYNTVGDNASLLVTVIPEPMTIALLGLGSLFLLRRRK